MVDFLRQLPNGKTVKQQIDRGPHIDSLSKRFNRLGGLYMITIHENLDVHLVAAIPAGVGKVEKLAEGFCRNDPVLPDAVDALVEDSMKNLVNRFAPVG